MFCAHEGATAKLRLRASRAAACAYDAIFDYFRDCARPRLTMDRSPWFGKAKPSCQQLDLAKTPLAQAPSTLCPFGFAGEGLAALQVLETDGWFTTAGSEIVNFT